jgi:hypothetical protein
MLIFSHLHCVFMIALHKKGFVNKIQKLNYQMYLINIKSPM